ncbi:MAG: NifB/NifX family molybdenum-iron cluster-binding protein [Thermoproteales archaeon]|nr:NifB/NifX family molybdenum-iron cluster-binding protein [Thermoproteales archaeon]
MKLAFTMCNPNGLDSMVCPWEVASFLVIVELKDGEVGEIETVSGFQSFFYSQPFAQGLEDVDALITASFSPYAPVTAPSGVKIYLTPPYTTVRRALEMYRDRKLTEASSLWQAPSRPLAGPFSPPSRLRNLLVFLILLRVRRLAHRLMRNVGLGRCWSGSCRFFVSRNGCWRLRGRESIGNLKLLRSRLRSSRIDLKA